MASARSTAVEALSLVAAVAFLDLSVTLVMLASLADTCQNVQQSIAPIAHGEAPRVLHNEFLFNISNTR